MGNEAMKDYAQNMGSEKLLEKVYKRAFDYESEKGGCSQCVLAALKEIGIVTEDTFKAGDALAGGIALTGNGACGALSGGVMAISYCFGRDYNNFVEYESFATFEIAKKLYDNFIEEYGSCICKDIQKKIFGRSFNFWDPREYEELIKAGGRKDKCPDVVGKAARWTVEIILQHSKE